LPRHSARPCVFGHLMMRAASNGCENGRSALTLAACNQGQDRNDHAQQDASGTARRYRLRRPARSVVRPLSSRWRMPRARASALASGSSGRAESGCSVLAARTSPVSVCKRCQDVGWVCESHPDRPWGESKPNGRICGAGEPCPDCNPSESEGDPPRTGGAITSIATRDKGGGAAVGRAGHVGDLSRFNRKGWPRAWRQRAQSDSLVIK
jgi:hypothetical protein